MEPSRKRRKIDTTNNGCGINGINGISAAHQYIITRPDPPLFQASTRESYGVCFNSRDRLGRATNDDSDNIAYYPEIYTSSNPENPSALQTPSYRYATDKFMFKNLSKFMKDGQTNLQIAESIKRYYDRRDNGYYAVIVSDEPILSTCWHSEGKYRYINKNKQGKYVRVWKQVQYGSLNKKLQEDQVKSCVN